MIAVAGRADAAADSLGAPAPADTARTAGASREPRVVVDAVVPDAAGAAAVWPALAPGTLVRISTWRDPPGIVWQKSPMFRATLLQATAESLRLAPLGDDRILDLARADVRLEVHAGRSHLGGAWAGAAFGLFVGLGVGTVAALVYGSRIDSELKEYAYIIYPVAFAAYGIPIGTVIGGSSGVDRWRRVE
jgi:hypothetical protein